MRGGTTISFRPKCAMLRRYGRKYRFFLKMVISHKSLAFFFLEKREKCLKHLWNSRSGFQILRKKIFTGGLVSAVLSGRKNANPLLNGGRTHKFLRPKSAMLRRYGRKYRFFLKDGHFSQNFEVFFGRTRKMPETPLKQPIWVPNIAQKNLHRRISFRRFKWS